MENQNASFTMDRSRRQDKQRHILKKQIAVLIDRYEYYDCVSFSLHKKLKIIFNYLKQFIKPITYCTSKES